MPTVSCPIWGGPVEVVGSLADGMIVDAPRTGGTYGFTRGAAAVLEHITSTEHRAKITTWLVNQRRFSPDPPLLTSSAIDLAEQQRPLSVSTGKERIFRYLLTLGFRPNGVIKLGGGIDATYQHWLWNLTAWTEALDDNEVRALLELLVDDGLMASPTPGRFKLTAQGFRFLEELERSGGAIPQAFVAMWFDESMQEAWRSGFKPGIMDAGYEAFRIDGKEHNKKIDDEIVAEIKRSRFLVADFTCGGVLVRGKFQPNPRGGVYYEAGLAHGLGMEVIFCCRKDRLEHLHFDTRQFAHIVWEKPADLRLSLYNRIAATLKETPGAPGRGKTPVDPPPPGSSGKLVVV